MVSKTPCQARGDKIRLCVKHGVTRGWFVRSRDRQKRRVDYGASSSDGNGGHIPHR